MLYLFGVIVIIIFDCLGLISYINVVFLNTWTEFNLASTNMSTCILSHFSIL